MGNVSIEEQLLGLFRRPRLGGRWITLAPALLATVLVACNDGPSGPDIDDPTEYLAGGGRAAESDPFVGGRGDSGPVTPGTEPGMPDIAPGYWPIFYSEVNCFEAPFTRVIATEPEWAEWLDVAESCQPVFEPDSSYTEGGIPPGRSSGADPDGTLSSDSAVVTEPTDPTDPPSWEPYVVDFDSSAVIAIGLESASGWGRSVQVVDVTTAAGVTTVRYEVMTPGEDCTRLLMAPFDPDAVVTAPVLAVVVPRPLGSSVTFERSETVWHCIIEPDPSQPLTLYYTDGECDLGGSEALSPGSARWEAWLSTAADCDLARWGGGVVEPTLPDGVRGEDSAEPGTTLDPPTGWLSPSVDFATHAVVVLRAPSQTRWGGGVWLTAIEDGPSGTKVDYAVMTPGSDCPLIEGGATVRPTVAIRVPLPLTDPVAFGKTTETIDCDWEPRPLDPGGTVTGSGGGTTGGGGQTRPGGADKP